MNTTSIDLVFKMIEIDVEKIEIRIGKREFDLFYFKVNRDGRESKNYIAFPTLKCIRNCEEHSISDIEMHVIRRK